MKYGKTKKLILIVLGIFILILIIGYFPFQKIEKQNSEKIVVSGPEIPTQGIIKNLGDLEITVFQAEESEYYDVGKQEDKKYYRIFLKISNWNQKEKQTISEMVLTDNSGNSYQLDNSIAFSADLEKLGKWIFYPMVTVDGYIIFPAVNENASKMDLVIKNKDGQIRFEFKK